ncbi:MAG: bis-aminopropyl spermidine synthase family protein [Nanopusillaceae archaeon]|nr:bis-aminopropyl spermidine synthase family protein [Candidatus Aenigmarchaeota archaeon]
MLYKRDIERLYKNFLSSTTTYNLFLEVHKDSILSKRDVKNLLFRYFPSILKFQNLLWIVYNYKSYKKLLKESCIPSRILSIFLKFLEENNLIKLSKEGKNLTSDIQVNFSLPLPSISVINWRNILRNFSEIRDKFFRNFKLKHAYEQHYCTNVSSIKRIKIIYSNSYLFDTTIGILGDDDLLSISFYLLISQLESEVLQKQETTEKISKIVNKIYVFDIDEELIYLIEKVISNHESFKLEVFDLCSRIPKRFKNKLEIFSFDADFLCFFDAAIKMIKKIAGIRGYISLNPIIYSENYYKYMRKLFENGFVIHKYYKGFNLYPILHPIPQIIKKGNKFVIKHRQDPRQIINEDELRYLRELLKSSYAFSSDLMIVELL